jgi:membrane protease YdiL (CAAX protease family)
MPAVNRQVREKIKQILPALAPIGRLLFRNKVLISSKAIISVIDEEHQDQCKRRTMLIEFSVLTLLTHLNYLSISVWHVQTYFQSNYLRLAWARLPTLLSVLLILHAARIRKPEVEFRQWLRWPPYDVWGRRLTAFLLVAIILVAVGTVIDRQIFQGLGWRGKLFAPDEAQVQWFRYLLQMPTIYAGEYLFAVFIAPLVEDVLFVGILFPSLRLRFNGLFAGCVAGFFFICGHDLQGSWHTQTAGEFVSFIALGFLGTLVRCWLLERFQSLYPCILLHIFVNFWNVFPDIVQAWLG